MGEGLRRAARAAKRSNFENTPKPAVRQVWADLDKRQAGREVRIDSITESFAYCTVIAGTPTSIGRPTRIHLDRLLPKANGFRYLRTEDEPVPTQEVPGG